ncbi:dTDP-4-dehydrorhamnose 3,5-epimerase [Terricaulis silvestris]|uniref:dTDP-4-dehydrorhamnose 3,5-epimerase n=1 Tax=Terricaulis silvestris TaxID=2686094 RepID=A0A6I6MZL6_9CAUL|nr:dTDP-4-dehydrorhamnose 3,5-epimerase [Terricaulis silvestris]QGZ96563.1 dTDP-4-dehydrorhamnose 3,5-epimerase [Terricaulis silvestris]
MSDEKRRSDQAKDYPNLASPIQLLAIADVWIFTPRRFEDERGWFSETFNAETLRSALGGAVFVQDNQSLSHVRGTLRGLHFQHPPRAQDKLVRVLRGSILDVAVDIRRTSPTFGQWVSAVLSAQNGAQLFVPKGFAHGFVTLEPDTEVLYKVSDYYSREHEEGIVWDDPSIAIDWTLEPREISMSERDRAFPSFGALGAHF